MVEAASGSEYNEPTEAWAGAATLLCKYQAGEKRLPTRTVAHISGSAQFKPVLFKVMSPAPSTRLNMKLGTC